MQVNATQNYLRLMERREQTHGRYDMAIRVRMDAHWFGEIPISAWKHARKAGSLVVPPLPSYITAGTVLNDRVVLGERGAFGLYARLYDDLINGTGSPLHDSCRLLDSC